MAIPYLNEDPPYVIVEDGDWLSKISRDYLGDIWAYPKLAAINNIPNPDKIYVGQQIYLSAPGDADSTPSNASQVTINQFGYQSNSSGTLFATWSWSKSNTQHYEVEWCYDTGDSVWFVGNRSTTEEKQSTYSIPSNAKVIKFRVKPISKTYTSNNKTANYWTAAWSTAKTYNVEDNPPSIPPVPTVEIDKYKLTATLDNLDVNATQIQFKIVKDNATTFKTGTANITTNHASYSCMVDAGGQYKVACRSYNGSVYSGWSSYSGTVMPVPAAPAGITVCKATSETAVYLEWAAVSSAETYTIEYTTKKQYFDGSDQTTSITGIESTHYEKTGLESGQEYFFRVRAANDQGESGWSDIVSVIIGKKPAAPTTWSSTTTAVAGEEVILYWVHNTEDGSSQKYAELELTINGVLIAPNVTIKNLTNDEEKDKTRFCIIDTQNNYIRWTEDSGPMSRPIEVPLGDGCDIKWRVRTAGITNQYSDFSVQRTVNIYAPATLELNLCKKVGENLEPIEVLEAFPCYVSGLAGPSNQLPIGYHLAVISNETYETVDRIGNRITVNAGQEVYSKYFDITDSLMVELSAGNIDLENNIRYRIVCTVSMNSGLTAEATLPFTVAWTDVGYEPNAEISLDESAYVTHIKPFCRSYRLVNYQVNALTSLEYIETTGSQYIDTGFCPNNNTRLVAEFASRYGNSDTNNILGSRHNTSSKAFAFGTISKKWRFGYNATVSTGVSCDTNRHIVDMNKNVLSLDGEVIYTADPVDFKCDYSICLGAIKASSLYFGGARFYSCRIYDNNVLVRDLVPCLNTDGDAGMYDKVHGVFYGKIDGDNLITGESLGNLYTETAETIDRVYGVELDGGITLNERQVYSGTTADGDEVLYCQVEESELINGVTLSVYRREFDGGFTELATGLTNGKDTFITDPHPALDYARYRIVAVTDETGTVSYCDLPGYPVGGKSAIIQWDEAWSNFDVTSEDALEEPAWAGSILKLHYNIDVSDASSPDIELVEYVGREHPVGYYGTQRGHSSTWNVEIEANDEETLYAIRRLQNWMGDVYVREPSGSGYWASVKVSFSQKHRDLTIPVTFNITRVEGGV